MKFVAVELLEPLIHICNLSLSREEFPDDMKIARVVPIIKTAVETNSAITGLFYPFSLNFSKDLCMTELSILMIIFQYYTITNLDFENQHQPQWL